MRFFMVLAAAFSLLSPSVWANSPTWYRIELMLVSFHSQHLIGDESWPNELSFPEPTHPQYRAWLAENPQAPAELLTRLALPANTDLHNIELRLTEGIERINKRSDVRILSHQAWIEPVQEQSNALQHPISLSFLQHNNLYQLQGNLNLHVGRYLHINTDLVLQKSAVMNNDALPNNTDKEEETAEVLDLNALDLEPVLAANIRLNRRMRSGELHYIDHPLLGIIVKAVPIRRAEDL